MAIYYVDNTATGAANGASWTDAYTTLGAAVSAVAADNTIYVSHTHTEQPNVNTTYAFANGIDVFSVNKSDDSYAVGAQIDNDAGDYDITFSGYGFKILGMSFYIGDDFLQGANALSVYVDCNFYSNNVTPVFQISGADLSAEFKSCVIDFSSATTTSGALQVDANHLAFDNSTIITPTQKLIRGNNGLTSNITFSNCDLSGCTAAQTLVDNGPDGSKFYTFDRCKLPPNITGLLDSAPVNNEYIKVKINSCTRPDFAGATDDDNAYWYFHTLDDLKGEVSPDKITYLSATYDGSTGFSTLLEGTNCSVSNPLRHKLIELPAQDLTSNKTYTAQFTSNAALDSAGFWLEIVRPDATDMVLGVTSSTNTTRATNILSTTETDYTDDTGNTAGWASPKTYIYSDSITVSGMTGVDNGTVEIYVSLALPSVDVFVDPAVVIT